MEENEKGGKGGGEEQMGGRGGAGGRGRWEGAHLEWKRVRAT